MNTAPRVNYPLPLLATIAGTLVVIFMLAVLGFFAAANSWRQFTDPVDDPGGAACLGAGCGLVALLMIIAIPFFFGAVINGARDLTQPLQRMTGRLADKYSRRGSYWIAVRADDSVSLDAAPAPLSAAGLPAASSPGSAPDAKAVPLSARSGAVVWQAPAPATDFGAGLTQVDQGVRRPDSAAPPPPPAAADSAPTRVFRVDKPVYERLQVGEPLVIAHSRFLEHVYYIERQRTADPPLLHNKSLI